MKVMRIKDVASLNRFERIDCRSRSVFRLHQDAPLKTAATHASHVVALVQSDWNETLLVEGALMSTSCCIAAKFKMSVGIIR